MAKQIHELTVGFVAKVMTQIGYGVFTERGKLLNGQVFKTLEEASNRSDTVKIKNTVKPVYIEENPK